MRGIRTFDSTHRGAEPILCTVTGSLSPMVCLHLASIRVVQPSSEGCVDCTRAGHAWLQLRMCMECGYVGCCDSSQNRHALAHFRATRHAIARSFQPGEEWAWCYADRLWFERLTPTLPPVGSP